MAIPKGFKIFITPTLTKLSERFRKVTKKMGEMSAPHKKIAVILDAWVLRNFKSEGKSVGGWEPFAAGGRQLPGGGFDTSAKLLQDTGRLRASFIPFSSKGNAGIGSRLDYSETHEEGFGNIPQRRMLPKLAEVRVDIRKIFDGHVEESLKQATRQ